MTKSDALRKAWTTVLDVDHAESGQNFFDLGGDSLDAIEMLTIYEAETRSEFPLEALFSDGSFESVELAVKSAPAST